MHRGSGKESSGPSNMKNIKTLADEAALSVACHSHSPGLSRRTIGTSAQLGEDHCAQAGTGYSARSAGPFLKKGNA
jgi:hypothetical protein